MYTAISKAGQTTRVLSAHLPHWISLGWAVESEREKPAPKRAARKRPASKKAATSKRVADKRPEPEAQEATPPTA